MASCIPNTNTVIFATNTNICWSQRVMWVWMWVKWHMHCILVVGWSKVSHIVKYLCNCQTLLECIRLETDSLSMFEWVQFFLLKIISDQCLYHEVDTKSTNSFLNLKCVVARRQFRHVCGKKLLAPLSNPQKTKKYKRLKYRTYRSVSTNYTLNILHPWIREVSSLEARVFLFVPIMTSTKSFFFVVNK